MDCGVWIGEGRINGWVDEERRKKTRRNEGKEKEAGRGEEEKSDKLVTFPVHLNLSWFIRPSPPAQS